jgi:hypothetical protein
MSGRGALLKYPGGAQVTPSRIWALGSRLGLCARKVVVNRGRARLVKHCGNKYVQFYKSKYGLGTQMWCSRSNRVTVRAD